MAEPTEESLAASRKQIAERLRQEERQAKDREERNLRERQEELSAALKLLESIEKRQLIPEDQYRSLEKLLDLVLHLARHSGVAGNHLIHERNRTGVARSIHNF